MYKILFLLIFVFSCKQCSHIDNDDDTEDFFSFIHKEHCGTVNFEDIIEYKLILEYFDNKYQFDSVTLPLTHVGIIDEILEYDTCLTNNDIALYKNMRDSLLVENKSKSECFVRYIEKKTVNNTKQQNPQELIFSLPFAGYTYVELVNRYSFNSIGMYFGPLDFFLFSYKNEKLVLIEKGYVDAN